MKTTHKTLLATAVIMGVMLPVGTITAMAEETKESPESQQPAVTEVAPVENVEPTPIVEETPVVQEQEPFPQNRNKVNQPQYKKAKRMEFKLEALPM